MGTLIFDMKQSGNHSQVVPRGTEAMLREPIVDLKGKVTVILSRSAKGTHHRKGISLKRRPRGSYEIRGTVQPGGNDTCREFVAQVDSQLDPATVYTRWQNPPMRSRKQVVDPPLSRASIEAMRQVASALPTVSAFNLNEFWKVDSHFGEVISCLTANDVEDDIVEGEAFRTAVRMVLEAQGLTPKSIEFARSLSILTSQGRIESIGNVSPYESYRLVTKEGVKEEEVVTIADRIECQKPEGGFVLQRFWERNLEALKKLVELVEEHIVDGNISKQQLSTAILLVLQDYDAEGSKKQIGNSLQALNIMGVIMKIASDELSYRWIGFKASSDVQHEGRKSGNMPIIKVVGIATIVDALVGEIADDEHLLDRDAIGSILGGLYAKKKGRHPSRSMVGHAIHQLLQRDVLEAKGIMGSKTLHLTLQAISDAVSRKVVAPKQDRFSGVIPLDGVLEALTLGAENYPLIRVRTAVEAVSKTGDCPEDVAVDWIAELVMNGYLVQSKGHVHMTYKVTAKTELHLSDLRQSKPSPSANLHKTPAKAMSGVTVPPARISLPADARTIGDVTPTNGSGQLDQVRAALQTIEGKIFSEQRRKDEAQAVVVSASAAIAELEEDKRQLEVAKSTLEEAAKSATAITAKYAN